MTPVEGDARPPGPSDMGADQCVTDDAFFTAEMAPLLAATCIGCHIMGGSAQGTRYVLVP